MLVWWNHWTQRITFSASRRQKRKRRRHMKVLVNLFCPQIVRKSTGGRKITHKSFIGLKTSRHSWSRRREWSWSRLGECWDWRIRRWSRIGVWRNSCHMARPCRSNANSLVKPLKSNLFTRCIRNTHQWRTNSLGRCLRKSLSTASSPTASTKYPSKRNKKSSPSKTPKSTS